MKNRLKALIDSEDWDELRDSVPGQVHIGKKSAGWKFLWDANNFSLFKPTKESLLEWLKSGQITDGSGKNYTIEEFWIEIKDFLDTGFDLESYYKANPNIERWRPSHDAIKVFEDYGVFPNQHGEFYIGNLRFSIYNNFG